MKYSISQNSFHKFSEFHLVYSLNPFLYRKDRYHIMLLWLKNWFNVVKIIIKRRWICNIIETFLLCHFNFYSDNSVNMMGKNWQAWKRRLQPLSIKMDLTVIVIFIKGWGCEIFRWFSSLQSLRNISLRRLCTVGTTDEILRDRRTGLPCCLSSRGRGIF